MHRNREEDISIPIMDEDVHARSLLVGKIVIDSSLNKSYIWEPFNWNISKH